MEDVHRTTVYLDRKLHRALRLKAADTGASLSALVNDAVRAALAEDLEDIAALDARVDEPSRRFEDFVNELADAGEL